MADVKFPSEIVSLPSQGKYYTEDNPLKSGKIEIKYPTAQEEDILTSQNLIKRGVVIPYFLKALFVDSTINLDTMLLGDKNALMIVARILAYGNQYNYSYTCSGCGEKNEEIVNLNEFPEKEFTFVEVFEFKLPVSNRDITFKLLTHADERAIETDVKALRKALGGLVDHEFTTRLKCLIVTLDGETDRTKINNFVDNEFLSQDSLQFRNYLDTVTPNVEMVTEVECKLCGYEEEITVPLTVQFFWPTARI